MARSFIDGEWQDGELRGLTFLAGERGMGKTTEMIRLVDQCSGSVVFFDTVGTHVHLLRGFVEFNQPGELEEYLRANLGRRVRAVYVPRDEFPEQHLIAVCLLVRGFGMELSKRFGDRGGMILVIDEIDQFCGPKWGDERMPRPLYNLAHFGRHYHTSMACTARDPATLSIKFRSQCAVMRIFRTSEETYVQYFARKIGKHNAAKLPTLKKTFYLLWRAGELDAHVCGGPRRVLGIPGGSN
jgi:hypothetical protein